MTDIAPLSARFIRALKSAATAKDVRDVGNEYATEIGKLSKGEIEDMRAIYRKILREVPA